MPSLSTLTDNFNDGTVGANWGNSYGGVTETGGKARVPCTTGFAGYQTAYSWTLAGASLFVKVTTVPTAGAATECYCGMLVNSGTDGTRIGFTIKAVGSLLRMQSDSGYFDGAAVEIAYSPVTHAYLRLREDGTNVYWDTSPDGTTWTNRRTLATPAWVTTGIDTCALDMSSHRDAGTNDYAEYDNFNTLADGAVFTGSAALTADGALGAAATPAYFAAADLTADTDLGATEILSAHAAADLAATSELGAETTGTDTTDVDTLVGTPASGWMVSKPWR